MSKVAKIFICIGLVSCLAIGIFSSLSVAEGEQAFIKTPLRLGYCEGEEYYEFDEALYYLILGLDEYGLIDIDGERLPKASSRGIWQYVCGLNSQGWQVKFEEKAFFSLSSKEFANMSGSEVGGKIYRVADKAVDMIITMGTTAGLAVRDIEGGIPFINIAAADPVKSGIVGGSEYSGLENGWAVSDTDAFGRSISVMNDILSPKKVGIVYSKSNSEAYVYSGADVLDKLCSQKDIEVVRGFVDDFIDDEGYDTYLKQLKEAYARLAESGIDAFVLTTSLVRQEDLAQALQPLYDRKIPVYSINSAEDVKYGALMAAESSDYKNIGRFTADTLGEYLGGAKLSQLPQIYQTAPFLVINAQTAKKIGYAPSFNLLLSASKIY